MLCTPSLPKSEIHEMNETNGTENYKAQLVSSIVNKRERTVPDGQKQTQKQTQKRPKQSPEADWTQVHNLFVNPCWVDIVSFGGEGGW